MKTGRIAPDIRRTPNPYKAPDIRMISNICKTPNIRKILLYLDGRNGIYRVSKVREGKASRPILDAEEVTVLLSLNARGLRILLSKDLYIYLIKEG
jgi:hypothetical protein